MKLLRTALLPAAFLLHACSQPDTTVPLIQPPVAEAAAPTPAVAKLTTPEIAPKVSPTTTAPSFAVKHPIKVRTASLNGTNFTAVTFDRRDYFLKVIDQKGGPGSKFSSAQDAGTGSLAVINGGFFTPEGSPLGLVISGGESRGTFNSASFLGTGILDGEKVSLATRQNYKKSSELLQTGPRLIWAGETLTGLSTTNVRPRSFMIWDGENHFGLVYADSASLKGLSNNLKSQPIPGIKIKYAVNLDGGTSCDLWVSEAVAGGGFSKNSFLRKKARNYLALKAR